MAIQSNPAIAKAEELLHRLGSLNEVRKYYEAREKEIRDENSRLFGAKEEGKIEEKHETAGKMFAKGLSEELILEITGLTSEDLAKLKKSSAPTD
ncbi:MAG TPA: hypothetical protein VEC37_08140 [Bacillota bacterium]|nr:hypothetical protein [Bacillota bacterium]